MDFDKLDEAKINEFRDKFKQKEITDEPIYHYTSLEALKNILHTNTLWATNCEYTNDLLELKDFERLINEQLSSKIEDIKLFYIVQKALLEGMQFLRKKTFLISFSMDIDKAMWKNYGKNGIVIEFDNKKMLKILSTENCIINKDNESKHIILEHKQFARVLYDDEKIIDYFTFSRNLLKLCNSIGNQDEKDGYINNILKNLLNTLFGIYFLKKDMNFSYEKEIRMVFVINNDEINKIENFRIKNNLIIPYISLIFKENRCIPIKKIIINPENKDEMYKDGLKSLLMAYNYDIPIIESKSKVRF